MKVSKKIDFHVKGNGEWRDVHSIVIGRTGIVHQQTHTKRSDNDDELKFNILATSWMAPASHLIVYYIHSTGEIVYDRIRLEFDSPSKNNVRIFYK